MLPNGTAAALTVTNDDVRKVNDYVFCWRREGNALYLARDMD